VGTALRAWFERKPVDPTREATIVTVDPDVQVDRELLFADAPLRDLHSRRIPEALVAIPVDEVAVHSFVKIEGVHARVVHDDQHL